MTAIKDLSYASGLLIFLPYIDKFPMLIMFDLVICNGEDLIILPRKLFGIVLILLSYDVFRSKEMLEFLEIKPNLDFYYGAGFCL